MKVGISGLRRKITPKKLDRKYISSCCIDNRLKKDSDKIKLKRKVFKMISKKNVKPPGPLKAGDDFSVLCVFQGKQSKGVTRRKKFLR